MCLVKGLLSGDPFILRIRGRVVQVLGVLVGVALVWWVLSLSGPFFIRAGLPHYLLAIVFAPCVFVSKEAISILGEGGYERLYRHEVEHIRQQRAWSPVLFMVLYVLMFIFEYIKVRNWNDAYLGIWFERKAREAENG